MTATCAFMNKQFFPCNIRTKQKNEQQVDRKRRCNTWLSSQQPVLLPYLKLDENTRFIDQSKEQFIKKQDMTVNQCGHHLSSVTLNNPSSKRVRSEPLDGTYDHPTTHIGRIYLPPNTFPVTVQSIQGAEERWQNTWFLQMILKIRQVTLITKMTYKYMRGTTIVDTRIDNGCLQVCSEYWRLA